MGDHNLPKGISPKVNEIASLEFELAYYYVTVQHVSHYATETPLLPLSVNSKSSRRGMYKNTHFLKIPPDRLIIGF